MSQATESAVGAPDGASEGPPPVPLRASAASGPPVRAVAGEPEAGSPRPYLNDALNSRLPRAPGAGKWKVRWSSKLDPELPVAFVLQGGKRIVLQGGGRFRLHDMDGRLLAQDRLGPSDVLLDPGRGLFYLADAYGRLEARRLADGEREFTGPLFSTEKMLRVYMVRRGRRFLDAAYERERNPHAASAPRVAVFEARDLGDPPAVESQVLMSSKEEALLFYEEPSITAASTDSLAAAAIHDRLLIADPALALRGVYTDEFEPLALSLDESGRIHLLVRAGERTALWVVTPGGERLFRFEVPQDRTIRIAPPVVGYDHRVFLATSGSVLAIDPSGRLLWERQVGGRVAGLAVSPDDRLLVAAGSSLLALDARGEPQTLQEFPGETLATPPAMSVDGDLLVATLDKLYRLGSQ